MTTSEVQELSTEYAQDPQATHRKLRAEGAVHRVRMPSGMHAWMITDYELARKALADPVLCKNTAGVRETLQKFPNVRAAVSSELTEHMLNSDPPDHTRLRKLVNRAFTMRAVQRLEPRVEQITAELLDAMQAGAPEVDLLDAFAFPLPITVICELLGVPQEDRDAFREWSNVIVAAGNRSAQEVTQVSADMAGYLGGLIAEKRAAPREDLLSDLINASDDDDRLSENELLSMVFLLLVAGHETTVNLIGNGVLALLRHPEQQARLHAEPALLPNAVEEFLRYDGPVNIATLRYTSAPWSIGGVPIEEREFVIIPLLDANRDEKRYDSPDTFDITRDAGGHIGFGHGIHFCVGAPLARLEGRVAVGGLLERFPRLTLAREPRRLHWRTSTLIHGLAELPVRLR